MGNPIVDEWSTEFEGSSIPAIHLGFDSLFGNADFYSPEDFDFENWTHERHDGLAGKKGPTEQTANFPGQLSVSSVGHKGIIPSPGSCAKTTAHRLLFPTRKKIHQLSLLRQLASTPFRLLCAVQTFLPVNTSPKVQRENYCTNRPILYDRQEYQDSERRLPALWDPCDPIGLICHGLAPSKTGLRRGAETKQSHS